MTTNFDSFRAAVSAGTRPEAAAWKTFTGYMAQKNGFTQARIVNNSQDIVVVEFYK
jgi:hypothetical protein